ncbi:MAG TPA: SEC-C metal-binding domain-containing protein [Kofleriaceae bacterium]|nr:SEC-C metal-binding domain-containing protein [Kofleriaceae bacterium]
MQVAEVGRNEPCPCGSGRKYKKCCLGTQAVGATSDRDVAALVDGAIANDAWEPVYDVFDRGFVLFEPMAPLEHVRFRDDLITANRPEAAELSRLCEVGWLRWCEREIGYVLERHELGEGERESLRLMVYMLRRFGAQSPVVEAIAELQASERAVRARNLTDVLSRHGLTMDEASERWDGLFDWFVTERPPILAFADWFALRTSSPDEAEALWLSRIAPRVCDICFGVIDRGEPADPYPWIRLAAYSLLGAYPRIGAALANLTPARTRGEEEQAIYTALSNQQPHPELPGAIPRIIGETEARGDFAGAALLRDAAQRTAAQRR